MNLFDILGTRTRMVIRDTANGVFELLHNGLAMVGLLVALALALIATRTDLRVGGEQQLVEWLKSRQQITIGMEVEADAVDRATATNPRELPKQQAAVAFWLANKYRVAPEPIAALVEEAYELSKSTKLDAHLILAIAAVESGFNPFAQSPVGAQGLMQVMTGIHADKYKHFGGKLAAFDPVTNLRVGVKVLQECIQRAGSVDAGLKFYVGAALHDNDGGYASKVYAEQNRLRDVAGGRLVSYAASGPQIAGGNVSVVRKDATASTIQAVSLSDAESPQPEPRIAPPSGSDPVTLNRF